MSTAYEAFVRRLNTANLNPMLDSGEDGIIQRGQSVRVPLQFVDAPPWPVCVNLVDVHDSAFADGEMRDAAYDAHSDSLQQAWKA